MDPLDHPAFPLRSINEPGLENNDTLGISKYADHRGVDFVESGSMIVVSSE